MKNIRIYCIFCIVSIGLLTTSCKKWLDVSPKTRIKEGDQFSSREGFYDAVFGIYQKASTASLYGAELSYGLLDILAQRYESKSSINTMFGRIARYDYEGDPTGSGKILAIWKDMYVAIAQCNYILQNTDKPGNGLSEPDRSIVKGEALGMRAFLHFDLLRMFAPAYLNGVNTAAPAIPYMAEFKVIPEQKLTVGEVLAKCEADLREAEALLAVYPDIDQIGTNQGSTSIALYLMFRQNHLNYWAAKAMLARLYLYMGNKPEALRYAREVINSGKFQFVFPESLIVDPKSGAADMTFSTEHVFSIYASDLKKRVDDVLTASNPNFPDAADLFTTRPKLNIVYESTLAGYGTDLRGPSATKSLWNQLMPAVVYSRKYYSDNVDNVRQSLIPVIRLPEMYYIAAEASSDLHDGVTYLNTVRTKRLIPALPDPASEAALEAEIHKEYRKEFFGEGQLWFYYKRKNTPVIPDGTGVQMSDAKYVFPYPLTELDYGK